MKPLLHIWSLGVEEQFYLIWPLLCLLGPGRRMPWLLLFAGASSLLANILLVHNHPSAVFYLPITRLWELVAGAALAWRARDAAAASLPPKWRDAAAILGMVILAGCMGLFDSRTEYPGWHAILPVSATMLLLLAGPQSWPNFFILSPRPIVFVGLISYPLYLWHWPLLAFLRIDANGDAPALSKAAALAAAFLLACATYVWIEKPIRSLSRGASRHAVVVLAAGMLVIAAAALTVYGLKGVPQRYPAALARFVAFHFSTPQSYREGVCFLVEWQRPQAWDDSCIDKGPGPLVLVWGDSHAAHLTAGLRMLQQTRTFRLGVMTAAGCPALLERSDAAYSPQCEEKTRYFAQRVAQLHPDTVILAGHWRAIGYRGLSATIAFLRKIPVHRVVVLGPVPYWRNPLPVILLKQAVKNDGHLPPSLGPRWYLPFDEAGMVAFVRAQGADYVSVTAAMCPGGQCVTMTGQAPESVTSFDASHFSDAGSRLFARRSERQLLAQGR
jgi:hypothetical protein